MARLRTDHARGASIARLLDPAVFEKSARDGAIPRSARMQATPRYRKRQVVLDAAAEHTLETLTDALRAATGTRLTTSHATRALLAVVAPSLHRIAELPPPPQTTLLPNNAPRFEAQRARFEHGLAELLRSALLSPR